MIKRLWASLTRRKEVSPPVRVETRSPYQILKDFRAGKKRSLPRGKCGA